MLIAELTVLVFAMQSILYFFHPPPSLQLFLWFLLPLICLFLSDTFRHRPSALRLQMCARLDSACSAAFVLVGSETSGAPEFPPGSPGGAGTRTWPFLHGHGAAPPRPYRGRLCPLGWGQRVFLVFLGVVAPPLWSSSMSCQLCQGQVQFLCG